MLEESREWGRQVAYNRRVGLCMDLHNMVYYQLLNYGLTSVTDTSDVIP
jgi:hypothetical protein